MFRSSLAAAALLLFTSSARAQLVETSTEGGGLFSEEAIPDAAPDSSLFVSPELPETASFEPSVRGHVELDLQLSSDTSFDRRGEHVFEVAFGARLELSARLTESLSAYVAPELVHVSALDREGGDRSLLYLDAPEAHVTWAAGPFHLRAGNLVFGWGSSDLIAPSDVLNPLDLRRTVFGSPDEAKIPIVAAEGVLALGPFTLRGVIAPVFTPSQFHLLGWDTALAPMALAHGLMIPDLDAVLGAATVDQVGDELMILDRPSDRPDNATAGFRGTLALDDLDVSATFVHGWQPLPKLRFDPDIVLLGTRLAESFVAGRPLELTDPDILGAIGRVQEKIEEGRDLLEGTYERRTVIGGDVTWAVDPLVLKADVAYTFSRSLYTQDFAPVSLPWLNAVVGAEYVRGETLQVIVEAFAITIVGVRSHYRLAIFEPRAAPPSASNEGGRDIALGGVAGVVRYNVLDGELGFELGTIATHRGDVILLPTIRWRIDDRHRLRIGGIAVEGPGDSYGGLYTNIDRVFVGYTWTP